MNVLPLLWLVIVLPLSGAALFFLFGRARGGENEPAWPGLLCSALMLLSFAVAVACALELRSLPHHRFELRGGIWLETSMSLWFRSGGEWGLLLDRLSAELMLLISGIGSLIHIYSIAYMKGEPGQRRYFGALNFFAAAMQLLVLANNYLLLFAGWEGVGLASYVLIGFHHERWRAGIAAMKAFIINRASDAAFVLAIFFLIAKSATPRFDGVAAAAATWTPADYLLAGSLLLVGAMGKSAQFPLHIWLPDAMEGPTPVSALIHSATMVCAGVYLLARSSFVLAHSPAVSIAVTVVGAITAFLAATVALAENDIKRVLAYSTVSQIGFMFMAIGAGAFEAALFHLFTHAFFKSLLFLGAGSVIHALDGEQNMKHMGGLRRRLPFTFAAMMAGALALSAVPGFAGFFSKDAILASLPGIRGGSLFFACGLITSLLTACYSWRLIFLVFYSEPRCARVDAHEAPLAMLAPMSILAVGCVAAGLSFSVIDWSEWPLMILSALLTFAGIALAWRYYVVAPERRAGWDTRFRLPLAILRNRWYIDALYEEKILNGVILRAAEGAAELDAGVIDASVTGSATLASACSQVLRWVDSNVVDGLVRFSSRTVRAFSSPVRAMQTGFVQTYALLLIAGLLAALTYYLRR